MVCSAVHVSFGLSAVQTQDEGRIERRVRSVETERSPCDPADFSINTRPQHQQEIQ